MQIFANPDWYGSRYDLPNKLLIEQVGVAVGFEEGDVLIFKVGIDDGWDDRLGIPDNVLEGEADGGIVGVADGEVQDANDIVAEKVLL